MAHPSEPDLHKRLEELFEEFAARMLAAQAQMMQGMLQRLEEMRPTIHHNIKVGPPDVFLPGGRVVSVRQSVDAVGVDGCKASVATRHP